MRILLVVDDYMPESVKIAGKMMHELAVELQRQGHSVAVLTPSSSSEQVAEVQEFDGVTVLRFWAGELKNISKVKRAINESLLSRRAWNAFRPYFTENAFDRIVYYSPSIFWGGLVARLKRIWKSDSLLILRDVFPEWAVDAGLIPRYSLAHAYFKLVELRNYSAADAIAVQSPANLSLVQKYQNKSEVLYNWSAPSTNSIPSSGFRQTLGLAGKVIFFYGGNIGHAQDMLNIVRLADALKENTSAYFLLVGTGDEVSKVVGEIRSRKLNNISVQKPVSQETYFSMLSEIDIGLISLHANHRAHNYPGKLLGYLEHQKPVLASINSGNDLGGILEHYGAGLVSINGQDALLQKHANQLLNDPDFRVQMGINGRSLLISQFSAEHAAKQVSRETLSPMRE